jgi:16S rRNA G966 N2-methylase RsmD
MNKETRQFIFNNIDADVHQLSLQSARFPLVDMQLAIRQIKGKQKTRVKIPTFFNHEDILYPASLSLEQSSSESTAKYKSNLCEGNTLVDLTGGFGIDCYFMSDHFRQVTYIEQNAELCQLAEYNFKVLDRSNIQVFQADSVSYLSNMEKVDWIFIDPARRNQSGKKVVLLSDCEPNIPEFYSLLMEKASRVLIKLSPMMDITAAVRDLPATSEVHILSVDNECKEVLLFLEQSENKKRQIKTVNLIKNKYVQEFVFYWDEESNAQANLTNTLEKYLYEPNASVLKSGAFKLIAEKFDLLKLHINTHLYTSSELLLQFPGRIFEVQKTVGNSRKDFKTLSAEFPKANLTVRNYPLKTDELRKKLMISEGGDAYLFACKLWNNEKTIICCRKVQ